MSEKQKELFPYLHGFSEQEQDRLARQARMTESIIYRNVDFSKMDKVIEVGCGVGAQTEILLRRYPELFVHGIDLNDKQLKAAKPRLDQLSFAKDRFQIEEMDASKMTFKDSSFDGAFLCWVLEHVPNPSEVLKEVHRVLRPGGKVFITEVMNSTFFLDPYSPNVWKYWMAFNDYQYENSGDPFVGAKLGNFLTKTGFSDITTQTVTFHFDARTPEQRKDMLNYWLELMLSASEQLLKAQYVDEEIIENAKKEMELVKNDPHAVFLYSFFQAEAVAP